MKKNILKIIIIIVVVLLAFYAGTKYAQSNVKASAQNNRESFSGLQGMQGGQRGARGGGINAGEIISKDDKSITIKLQAGGSKIIFFSPSTSVSKSVSGSPEDLKIGSQVNAIGTANSDGSVSADNIQIRPAFNNASSTKN